VQANYAQQISSEIFEIGALHCQNWALLPRPSQAGYWYGLASPCTSRGEDVSYRVWWPSKQLERYKQWAKCLEQCVEKV
jgi:hypothetical protein